MFHEYLIGLNSFPFTVWVGVKHSLLLKLSVVLGVLIYFLNFLTKDHFNSSEHTLSHFFRWLCFLFEVFFFNFYETWKYFSIRLYLTKHDIEVMQNSFFYDLGILVGRWLTIVKRIYHTSKYLVEIIKCESSSFF